MSYDREESPKTTQAPTKATSPAPAPKPKRWGGESGLGQKPTDEMLRAIFESAFREADSGGVLVAESGFPDMGKKEDTPDASKPRDEAEVQWGTGAARTAPDPFQLRDCLISGPAPRDPDWIWPARPTDEHPSHHEKESDPYGWKKKEKELERTRQQHAPEREKHWGAIVNDSAVVQASHDRMGSHLGTFRHAEKDPQLEALMLILPSGAWSGDVAKLTEMQNVPEKGGDTVGSLFDKSDEVIQTSHDKAAIASIAKSTKAGKGKTESAAGDTIKADAELRSSKSKVLAQISRVKAASQLLQAALAEMEVGKKEEEAAEIRDEISQLQQELEGMKETAQLMFDVATAVVQGVEGNVGDAMDKVGVVVATLIGRLHSGKLEDAQARLGVVERAGRSERAKSLLSRVVAARMSVDEAMHEHQAAKHRLNVALTERRQAYNNLGIAASKEVECPQTSQHRIRAILSAIPLVEMVVARVSAVHAAVELPTYSTASGLGLGMAEFHQPQTAANFQLNLSELRWANTEFSKAETKWTKRLEGLQAIKQQIILPRPAGE